jgi:transketolase
MRTTFINTLIELARKDSRIYLVIADLGFSVVEDFQKEFPERFINTGIAEANAVNIASGLAVTGKIPFVYSIVPFLTMRAFEQVRVNCAYMNTNVKLVGVGGGVAYGPAGATHHAIEDISIMRSLPNMKVIAPGDPIETKSLIKSAVDIDGPTYIRLSKNNEPLLVTEQKSIVLGKANIFKEGDDLTILSTGNFFESSIKVSELLEKKGYSVELANFHTIKPLDKDYLLKRISLEKPIFTIEEHNIIGGLGSAVSEVIAESTFNPLFKRFGIPDKYSHFVGDQEYIRKCWDIDSLGGYDPYSSSKCCCEYLTQSYYSSFMKSTKKKVATVRAGNVIGGGDWSENRIVPDCIKSLLNEQEIEIRNPIAVRPWQHVLEPLAGYLIAAKKLVDDNLHFSSWNFGPNDNSCIPVQKLVDTIIQEWGFGSYKIIENHFHETNFLALDYSKAKYELNWSPAPTVEKAIKLTVDWYKQYIEKDVYQLCFEQIDQYCDLGENVE